MRLATWNLLHGRSLTDGQVVTSRLADGARTLAADVLGLQEVDRGQARTDGRDLTAEVAEVMEAADWRFLPAVVGTPGYTWRAAEPHDDHADGDVGTRDHFGIGLVSRYPVLEWHELRLPASRVRAPIVLPGSSKVVWLQDEPRRALAAVVQTPHGVMTVATAHLSFVPGWNGAQLRKTVAMLAGLPGPRVLLADLNMPPPFPRWLTGWTSLARTPTYPSTGPKVQLDHVLASGRLPGVRSVAAPALPVSDHCALVVEFDQPPV